jgi:hypothetical protein
MLMALAGGCGAQTSSMVSLSNGVQVRITGSAGGQAGELKAELAPASGNSFYRVFRDENNLAVYAYEVMVERTPDGEQFRVVARPAGSEFAARFPNADGGKPTPTLAEPRESPLLNSGETFSIEIPTNPGAFDQLTDTVQVQAHRRGALASDSAAQDSEQLRFSALRVSIDGNLASPSGPASIVTGRYVMFYIPGHGGYFFSVDPVAQRPFAQVGRVDQRQLRFTIENVTYECRSDAPVLTHSERGQVWVYHDPDYKPAGNWTQSDPANGGRDEFFTAASDSLNWWLP